MITRVGSFLTAHGGAVGTRFCFSEPKSSAVSFYKQIWAQWKSLKASLEAKQTFKVEQCQKRVRSLADEPNVKFESELGGLEVIQEVIENKGQTRTLMRDPRFEVQNKFQDKI